MNTFLKIILGLILLTGCVNTPIEPEDDMNNHEIDMLARRIIAHSKEGSKALQDKKGWSVSGPLISGAGPSGNGISLQANFENEPGNYTVQFGLTQPVVQSGEIIRAVAEIVWSVEGNDVRRLVNAVNGMSVSGTAQGVKVRLFDNSVTVAPITYQVSAQVVKGTRPSVAHPPFLYGDRFILISGGPSVVVPIPQNAGVTAVYVGATPTTAVNVPNGQLQVAHESAAATVLQEYEPRDFQWVPIGAGADRILIRNNSAEPISFTPVWGIDG